MDERQHEQPRYPLPEVIQPDPMLEPERNLFGTAMVYLGAAAIVVLVLYGQTRPEGAQQQVANAPSAAAQTAPAGGAAAPPPSGPPGKGRRKKPARPDTGQNTGKGKPARSDSSNDNGSKNQPRQRAQ